MKTAVYTTLIAGGILCAFLMLCGMIFCSGLLALIHTPTDIFADSKRYLDIYILGFPFVLYYNVATGIFSALGDSRTPFLFLACSSISNIAVDILFVAGFGMGVEGVAWATFLCQGVSCMLAIVVVFRKFREIQVEGAIKIFSWKMLGRISGVAVPSILQQSFVSVGNIIIQGVINGFGVDVVAGYSASVKLNNMVITSFTTLANGISNYTAQNLGAGKYSRIKEGFQAGIRLVWTICVPVALLYFIASKYLVSIFVNGSGTQAMHTGILFLRILSPFYFAISMKLVADGVLRGAGYMRKFMAATFTDLALRVVLAVTLSRTALGATGIWVSWPIGWVIAMVMSVWFYRGIKWEK